MENILASVDSCLQTSCSFLSSTLFLKESRTSPSYRPLPDLCRHKGTAAHAKGQTSSAAADRKGLDATGAGVFFCITPHTYVAVLNNPFQSTDTLRTLQYSKFGLHTVHKMFCISYFSYFQCWSGSQGTEISTQLCNRPSPTLGLHHNHAALRQPWTCCGQWEPNPPPERQSMVSVHSQHEEDWLSGLPRGPKRRWDG